jgi:transposase InsO family protein
MPWIETRVMDERLSFVAEALAEVAPVAWLCERYGISRKTGYKWLGRYRALGPAGLADRSRARHHSGPGLLPEVAAAVLALRRERPHWGPKKLKAHLAAIRPELVWPATSTIGDLLKRAGLVTPRGRRRGLRQARPGLPEATVPNDRWSIDFKGWFRTRDGRRCDPLTIADAASRYILELRIVEPRTVPVEAAVDRVLREQGLPERLLMDNGPPFASTGAGGLTRLAVQWLKLGIRLERITPGKPQENGRHERMHRTLKAETSRPAAATAAEQQARFDTFRHDFNHHRPHEALGQRPPASVWQPAPRPYPSRIEEPWYDAEHQVRRVRPTGEIKWQGGRVFLSEALAGEPVGLAETASGHWLVRFCDLELGLIDRTGTFRRFAPGRGRRATGQGPVDLLDGAAAPPTTPQAPPPPPAR